MPALTPPHVLPGLDTAVPRRVELNAAARYALGPLLRVMEHPAVRDILIQVRDSVGELWVDSGASLARVRGWQCSPEAVRSLASALISAGGRHIDELHPIADVHLGDGIRVHAVLPPIAVAGAVVSMRLPEVTAPTLTSLIARGLCGNHEAQVLREAVSTRKNLLLTGGTGTGKTTLLAALLNEVPRHQRILTVEDVAELRITHPHRVALEVRQANVEGAGEVTLNDLLTAALRMRPDRVVLGECRGAEIVTLLSALNTGHDGGAGTLHANSMGDVSARLEALGALAGLSPDALARQAASAFQLIVHLKRTPTGKHRISGLGFPVVHRGVLHVRACDLETV